jgi:hypothetical protein
MEEPEEVKPARPKLPVYWRELITDKFVDLIMLILGVYIAFQLNNWKIESDQQSLARFYMESMLNDLNKDIKEINENLVELKHDSASAAIYINEMSQLHPDSLGEALLDVLSLETFVYNNNTYQTLVSGNGLSAFSSRDLKTQITEYYNLYVPILRFDNVYTNVIFKINDYFVNDVDYAARKVINKNLIRKPSTKNYLLLGFSQLEDGIEAYEDALSKAESLKKSLERGILTGI